MDKLSINNIPKNFFRNAPQKIEAHQSNPFGVSFKGNVLTSDVFETKREIKQSSNLIERASRKSKMLSSVVVGSINEFSSAVGRRLNSVISFGNRIRENVSGLWNQAKNIEITFDMANIGNVLKSKLSQNMPAIVDKYSVKSLTKLPVGDLEEMLVARLAKI